MSDIAADMKWVVRELASIERDLSKAIDAFEPPTAREVMSELARVVRVLQELYPEPEWDEES